MSLVDWPRQYYQSGGGSAYMSYAVFGAISQPLCLSASTYRSAGVPDSVEVSSHTSEQHPEIFRSLLSDSLFEALKAEDPTLAELIGAQQHCIVLQGEIKDPPTLNYFRDTIGLATCLLDQGGVAIRDVQMLKWWSPVEWRKQIFDHGQAYPSHHVVILVTPEEDGREWFHTRGMLKFGRPDISVRNVPPRYRNAIIELCNRFIALQAFGAIVPEGQEIRMAALPPGMKAQHRGSVDDFAFNNVHIEIAWPPTVLNGGWND